MEAAIKLIEEHPLYSLALVAKNLTLIRPRSAKDYGYHTVAGGVPCLLQWQT
jgi:hypothetical protein